MHRMRRVWRYLATLAYAHLTLFFDVLFHMKTTARRKGMISMHVGAFVFCVQSRITNDALILVYNFREK